MNIWWMSFVNPDKPKGQRFVGIILVDADSFEQALNEINKARINPGGEVAGWECQDPTQDQKLANMPRLTLLSQEQLKAFGEAGMNDEAVKDLGGVVCAEHNPSSRSVS